MRKTNLALTILLIMYPINFLMGKTIHIFPNDEKSRIENIFIELGKYNLDLLSGYSLFLKLEEIYNPSEIIVQWDVNQLKKDMKMKTGVPVCVSGKESFNMDRLVYEKIRGGGSTKITKEIIPIAFDEKNYTILEIPICSNDLINSDEIIQLYDLPIIFSDNIHTKSKIQICSMLSTNSSFDQKISVNAIKRHFKNSDWQNLDYHISKTTTKIDLNRNYKVFNSAEPFYIDLSLEDVGPSSLTSDREIRLNLENGAVWDSNVTDIIVKDKRANILNGEKITINHTMSTLILTFKEDILSKEISIENLPVICDNLAEKEIKVSLSSAFNNSYDQQKENDSILNRIFEYFFKKKILESGDYEIIKQVSTTKRYITTHNIEFVIDHDDKGIYSCNYTNGKDYISLPSLIIKQNKSNVFKKGQRFSIIIPDDLNLFWDDKHIGTRLLTVNKKSGKILELSLIDNLRDNEQIVINNLRFKNPREIIKPFQPEITIHGFRNKNNLKLFNPISIGFPDFGLEKPLFLYTSIVEPSISSFYIRNNGFIVVGDKFVINLTDSREIYFKTDRIYGTTMNDKLKVHVEKQKLMINILEEIPIDEKIQIDEIFIEALSKSEQSVFPKLEYIPGKYQSLKKTRQELSSNSVNIISLEVDLANNVEYINNLAYQSEVYDLPEVIIKNTSALNTPKFESLFIGIPYVDHYFIQNENVKIVTSLGAKTPRIKILNDKVLILLQRSLFPSETITINGLAIRLARNEPSFISKNLVLGVTNSEDINVETSNSIGYGIPRLVSKMDQQFFDGRRNEPLYGMTVNLKQLPKTAKLLDKVVIKIPDNIDMVWAYNSKVTLTSDIIQMSFKINTSISEDKKQLFIPVSSFPVELREKLHIGDMFFGEVGGLSEKFRLSLSLDNGKTFVSEDEHTKQIISKTKQSGIVAKEINEKYFPFNKGNELSLILPPNSPYQWVTDTSLAIYHEYSAVQQNSNMFSTLHLSEDKKKLNLPIINDRQTGSGKQMMDFDQLLMLSLKIFSSKPIFTIPDIKLGLQTIYGYQELNNNGNWDEIIYYSVDPKIKRGDVDRVNIKINLFKHPNYSSEEIYWYHDEDNLLSAYSLDHSGPGFDISQNLNDNNKQKKLGDLKTVLEEHYRSFRSNIEYDWIFWYYLGRYKFEKERIMGSQYQHYFKDQNTMGDEYIDDIEKAQTIGYTKSMETKMWNPVTGERDSLVVKIFDIIYKSFEEGKYYMADSILFKELFLTKSLSELDNHIEASVRFLDAVIAECFFNDDNILRKGRTYVDYQKQDVEKIFDYDEKIKDNIRSFSKNYSYLENLPEKIMNDTFDCSLYPDWQDKEYAYHVSSLSSDLIDPIAISLSHMEPWDGKNLEQRLRFKKYFPKSKEKYIINEYGFGRVVTLDGGKTYSLYYDPTIQNKERTYYIIGSGLLFGFYIGVF